MIAPYYSDDHVTIYHGDCLDPELVPLWCAADVLVTDPPYGIDWTDHGIARTFHTDRNAGNYNGAHRAKRTIMNDKTTAVRDAALAAWGTNPAFVFGALKLSPPEATRQVAIYAKPADAGGLSGVATVRRDAEAIYILGDSDEWQRPKGRTPRASIPQSRRQPSEWRSSVFTTSFARVGGIDGIVAQSGHPHAKPTDVLRDLISLHSGVVADPFMGSGSTLRAAKDIGRKAIGVELDERYCEVAAKRMGQEVLDFGGAA